MVTHEGKPGSGGPVYSREDLPANLQKVRGHEELRVIIVEKVENVGAAELDEGDIFPEFCLAELLVDGVVDELLDVVGVPLDDREVGILREIEVGPEVLDRLLLVLVDLGPALLGVSLGLDHRAPVAPVSVEGGEECVERLLVGLDDGNLEVRGEERDGLGERLVIEIFPVECDVLELAVELRVEKSRIEIRLELQRRKIAEEGCEEALRVQDSPLGGAGNRIQLSPVHWLRRIEQLKLVQVQLFQEISR